MSYFNPAYRTYLSSNPVLQVPSFWANTSTSFYNDITRVTNNGGTITPTSPFASYAVTGNTTSGSNQITSVSSTTNLAVGQIVIADNFNTNTKITSIVGSTVTVSNTAQSTASTHPIRFAKLTRAQYQIAFCAILAYWLQPCATSNGSNAWSLSDLSIVGTPNGDTTNSSTTISNITDMTNIQVGQYAIGSGIPNLTRVVSVGANSVVLDTAATATASAQYMTFSFGLACSQYVKLTMEYYNILDSFGANNAPHSPIVTYDATKISVVGTGWNGGAIGNHAQIMAYDPNSTQPWLLIDPLCGLLSLAGSYDTFLKGTAVAADHCITWWNTEPTRNTATGISAFEGTVVGAITAGSYKPSDILYYLIGLQQFDAAGTQSRGTPQSQIEGENW